VCSTYGEEDNCIHGLDGETLRKDTRDRPRNRWRITLKWILKVDRGEVGWGWGGWGEVGRRRLD
jgi:hypothetical protein